MNSLNQFKHLTRQEVSDYFSKEASKACSKSDKLTWINQYIQRGGTIPNKDEFRTSFNISAILRENRTERMQRFSLKPSEIETVSQKTLKWIEEKKTNPGIAIDLGGGNSSLALTLLQKKWKVIVVDSSEKALHLLHMRARLQGLGAIAQSNLFLLPQTMETFTFPSGVDFISAQASLPYCDANKVVSLWEKIHHSLASGGYFAADFFNSCSSTDPLSSSYDDDTPDPAKEIVSRVRLGAWIASPSVAYSLLKNSSYNTDYFALDNTSIEFIGRK